MHCKLKAEQRNETNSSLSAVIELKMKLTMLKILAVEEGEVALGTDRLRIQETYSGVALNN